MGGVDKVFLNLCKGLDRIDVRYETNLPFQKLELEDRVGVLGRGRHCLNGYNRSNPIVAGVALMTHPSEWPTLCEDYPVVAYLQHSEWTNNVYKPYFGERCMIWPVGIDTEEWRPFEKAKDFDFLIYDKILWDRERKVPELLYPIEKELKRLEFKSAILRYGNYDSEEYKDALARCRAMIFLCEHESQGIAYQEALSSGVPILAWDQGWCLDPNRFAWGEKDVPATSVPYFDERCGRRFKSIEEFSTKLAEFVDLLQSNTFSPREYILENLTLDACAQRYLDILNEVAQQS
jgi:hypothetical protein